MYTRQAVRFVEEYNPDNLIAGNTHPQDTKAVVLAAGTGTYLRGTLINSLGSICNSTLVEEEKVLDQPVGILTDDVTLSEYGTTNALMYISGDFRASEIIVGADVEVADFERESRMLGMFLK